MNWQDIKVGDVIITVDQRVFIVAEIEDNPGLHFYDDVGDEQLIYWCSPHTTCDEAFLHPANVYGFRYAKIKSKVEIKELP